MKMIIRNTVYSLIVTLFGIFSSNTVGYCSGVGSSENRNLDFAVIELLQRYENQMNLLAINPESIISFDNTVSQKSSVFVPKFLHSGINISEQSLNPDMKLIPFLDFIETYKDIFRNKFDPINKSGLPKTYEINILENFIVDKVNSDLVYQIPAIQKIRIRGKKKDFAKTNIIEQKVWFTITIPIHPILKDRGARIIRINNNKLNFNHLVPDKLNLSFQPGIESVIHDSFVNESSFAGSLDLTGSWLIGGVGKTNLYLTTGIGFGQLNKQMIIEHYRDSREAIDIDDQKYSLIIEGSDITQDWKMDYMKFPILLDFSKYYPKSRWSIIMGAEIILPVQLAGQFNDGQVEYMGEYSFEGYGTHTFRDLPAYGFVSSSVPNQNFTQSAQPWINGLLGITYAKDIGNSLSLSIGAFAERSISAPFISINSNVEAKELTPFIGLNEFSSHSKGYINVGLSYKLFEPRNPYFNTRSFSPDMLSTKETGKGVTQFTLYFAGQIDDLKEMPKVEYFYDCVELVTSEKYLIKSGKFGYSKNGKKMKLMDIERDFRTPVLHILKPFGYDLEINNDSEILQITNKELEIAIPKNQLDLLNSKILNIQVAPRTDYNLILVDLNGSKSRLADKKMSINGYVTRIARDLSDLQAEGVQIEFQAYSEKTKPFAINSISKIELFKTVINETTISSSGKLGEILIEEIGDYDILARRRLTIHCFVGSLDAFRSKTVGKGLLNEYLVPLLSQTGVKEFLPYINIKVYHFGEFTPGDLIEGPFEFIRLLE